MKIKFWLKGSGGQRSENKIVEFSHITLDNLGLKAAEIEDALDEWVHGLHCHSEYVRWGWEEMD
jgi:hypothetical protein